MSQLGGVMPVAHAGPALTSAEVEAIVNAMTGLVRTTGNQEKEGNLTIASLTGELILKGALRLFGTSATVNATPTNNLEISSPWIRCATTVASAELTGMVYAPAQINGLLVLFSNEPGSKPLTFAHESASSTAANRFKLSTLEGLTLRAGQSMIFLWNPTSARWENLLPPLTWATQAPVEHTSATYELKPVSAARNADVLIRAVSKAATAAEYNVKVGTTTVTQIIVPKGISESTTFDTTVPVPAGEALTVEKVTGELAKSFTQVTLK